MKKLVITALALLLVNFVFAQDMKFENRVITKSWTVNPKEFNDDFHFSVTHLEAPFPGGESERESLKDLKEISDVRFPRTGSTTQAVSRGAGDTLKQLDNFAVRFFLNDAIMTGGTPNDNTLAISNGGRLLTSYNTQLWGYDLEADTFLFHYNTRHPSFNQFMQNYNDTTFSLYFPFDPKLIYDPVRDRFIMVFLTGRNPSNSAAVVCFSSTNYPTDEWHAYWLSGNPLDDNTWTDYPQIAINENNLYLTLNQLYPDSSWITGFSQTVIWQMDLDAGFAGADSLPVKLWYGANYNGSKLRYLHPVKTGMGPESDTMYFVANRPFDIQNDTFFLVRIIGDVGDQNASIDVKAAVSDVNYGLPPDAQQPGGYTFNTNDARTLGAVRMQNEIQFVGNTKEFSSGRAALFHGMISDVDNPTVKGQIITDGDLEFGYPNIDFMGHKASERETVIFFNHSSSTQYAGNSALYYNNNREFGPIQKMVQGTTFVNRIPGNDERWGDYIGLQRRYNSSSRAWGAGYTSFGSQTNGTWVSEMAGPNDWPAGTETTFDKPAVKIFPNPVANQVSVQFSMESAGVARFELMDVNGKLVKVLAQDFVEAGKNEATFDLTPVAAGVYFLKVTASGKVITEQKLIRE